MKATPTIAVIGTLVHDEIHPLDGAVCESWGGLAYAFLTLATIAPDVRVVPVVNMGRDRYAQALSDFKAYPNIDPRCIYAACDKTNHVTLRYHSREERIEIQDGQVPPLTFEQVAPILDSDLILMNFISGTDMAMEPYHRMCQQARGPVYTDVHSMVLGRHEDGTRFMRPIRHSREWFAHTHFFQLNSHEATMLDRPESGDDLLKALILEGRDAILMTRGAAGVRYARRDGLTIRIMDEAADQPEKMVDPTGCGDAFGAGFCCGYLKTGNICQSVRYANRVAGHMSRLTGLSEIGRLAVLQI